MSRLVLVAVACCVAAALLIRPLPLVSKGEPSGGDMRPSDMRAAGAVRVGGNGVQAGHVSMADLPSVPDAWRECTRIVYQSWADSNWELYTARGDGTQTQRLTSHSGRDEAPSLVTRCDLVAFASNRDDNDEIYTMRTDGSDVQRITRERARDVLPSLSPDGTLIAFQTYRDDDQAEIYVADLASGVQTRLTRDRAYDGQPQWSPDGAKIAFISDRSGLKNVWVMDADGDNAHQITWLTHAGGPHWSPDGARIAFASDDQGTGFTSLWLVGADGSYPHVLWRPAEAQTDAWPGAWSYDGSAVLFEEAHWYYDADWYLDRSHINLTYPGQPGSAQRVLTGGYHMAPAWARCDLDPPTAHVNELPRISSSPAWVSWSGTSACAMRLEYQLQYRIGGTITWEDWPPISGQDWTAATAASLAWDRPGRVVYLRSRARENEAIVGPWTTNVGDTSTGFPARVGGRVTDVRGVPVPEALISGPAPYSQDARSRTDGYYELLAATEDVVVMRVAAPGYQEQQLHRPTLDDTGETDYALVAGAELLRNGAFESGQSGWQATSGIDFGPSDLAFGANLAELGGVSGAAVASHGALALWQAVTVEASALRPTLAFSYALGRCDGSPPGRLVALVDNTPVQEIDAPTSWVTGTSESGYPLWQHAWADLTPWRGQQVTITVRLERPAGDGYALLDQVSVADWLTPRVDRVVPAQVRSGVASTVVLLGDNLRGDATEAPTVAAGGQTLLTTWVSDTELQVTVPPTLAPGTYDLWVQNPSGHHSVIVGGLRVGFWATVPYVIR